MTSIILAIRNVAIGAALLFGVLLCATLTCAGESSAPGAIRPGQHWLDANGELINAHGFCVLHHDGTYYWYGAHKIPGKTEDEKNEAGVRCYTSTDLLNWKNAGMVLDASTPGMSPEVRDAYILDRPKVVYHAATNRFILYFKLYPPKEQGGKSGKDTAYVGVATAAAPTGPFEYQGRFTGGGSTAGSGDFAIFQNGDGAIYHIAVRKPDGTRTDKPLVCGRLSDDGLKPAGPYVAMEGVENATEGPALFRRDGKYYLLGSASTGWAPNPARLFVADHLTGPYQALGNPCRGVNPHNGLGPEKTFGGQSTFVFPVPGRNDSWIAMFDINQPKDPVHSGYIWLPVEFHGDQSPTISWKSEWSLENSLKLPAMFADHMVLQRDQSVPVWGWARPDTEVTVAFADQKKSCKADADGKWSVRLDPLAASAQPRVMEISTAAETTALHDVLVGDVWLCSGQSNMHFRLSSDANAQKEIASANQPDLRFFTVGDQFAQKPMTTLTGSWKPVSPGTAAGCSAVAYYFGKELQHRLGVPVGLLVSTIGGTRIETWMRPETLATNGVSAPLIEKWRNVPPDEFEKIVNTYRAYQKERDQVHPKAVREAKAKGAPVPPAPPMPKQRAHDCPSALHCGMIAPLQPYAIRGAIWYQGESNSGNPAAYETLLPAMIADWRQTWGHELPFLFVQLAPHRNTHPAFREAQQRIWQKTPRTAMAVTTDVGDANNIHPTRKRPVGERLALAARALSYGETLEYSGPVFQNMKLENERAVISFTHIGKGLMAKDGPLKGFTMAGADGKFVPARAGIEGSNVIVTSESITKPAAVRYAWANVPDANLFNRDGLPAAPFRSDPPVPMAPAGESK